MVAVVIAVGCTHHQTLAADGSPLEVGQWVTAHTRDGAEVEGVIVRGPLGGVRVRLHERRRRELELGELTALERESAGRGAVDGLLIGLATGVVLGAVLGAATYDDKSIVVHSAADAALLGAAFLGGIGGLVGTLGGAAGQATIDYQLPAQR